MTKILGIVFIGLLVVACGEIPNVNHKKFQSVDAKDAILLQTSKDKKYCAKCGMDLAKFYKTNHTAKIGSKVYQYCSIHCLEEHLGEGVTLKNPQVVNLSSLKFIDVKDAYYVVGSNKRGTMSRVSKYAFAKLADAKKFQVKNGGKIMRFKGALQEAKKDFNN